MKKELMCLILGSVMILSACGAKQSETIIYDEADTSSSMDENIDIDTSTQISETTYENESLEQPFETLLGEFDNTKDAYTALIKYMIDNSVEVAGINYGFCESYAETVADNQFAILDVDGDNEDELIIDWTHPNAMVGYTSHIFKYDVNTKEWINELDDIGGALTVFDNGIIYVGASHNQGYGEMWPYTIFKYNASNDMFERIGYAESEDKNLVIDSTGDDSFYHYEYDPTGCGTVYMFSAEAMGYEYGYYTKEQFEEFQNSLVGGAGIMEIDYKYITKENLEEIAK